MGFGQFRTMFRTMFRTLKDLGLFRTSLGLVLGQFRTVLEHIRTMFRTMFLTLFMTMFMTMFMTG